MLKTYRFWFDSTSFTHNSIEYFYCWNKPVNASVDDLEQGNSADISNFIYAP